MAQQMSQTPQPHLTSSLVAHFGSFDAAHGWAVNLFVVASLAGIGVALLSGRPRIVRGGVIAGAILCVADWVLVQDFGFFGGVGTDPNSMIPMALLFVAGYLAMVRAPAPAPSTATEPAPLRWRQHLSADPAYTFRSIAALAAIGVTLVGAAPMAFAAANPNAEPILTQAVDGPPTSTNIPAPAFDLVDQNGRQVSLTALRGKALAVTFLDPVCTTDCPIIAQEFRSAGRMLGADSQQVELIAIDANPRYTGRAYLTAFDQQEGLENVPNWEYLTGSLPALEHVWASFAVEVAYESGGAMIDHSDVVYIIDPTGHTREVLNSDPGPATGATGSAFAQTLARAAEERLALGVSRLSRRRSAAWAVAASMTAACLASCSSAVSTSGGSGGSTSGSGPAPLATSVNTADGTWATVAMGHLDDPANTFWQLLHRAAGAGLWTDQIQATAVATNGGLVMAPSQGGSLVVGVLPFDFLTFSPLVATANGGRSWSNGLLPGGLVTAPNALAANANGHGLAITGKDQSASSQMVLTSASLANWQPVASVSALASSADGEQCAIAGLSAVAFDGPDPVVGARCSHPGVIGLFEKKGSGWALIGPRPPAGTSQDDFAVNAVQAGGQGFSGLLSASGPRGTSVMVVSTDDARPNLAGVSTASTDHVGADRFGGAGRGRWLFRTPGQPDRTRSSRGPGGPADSLAGAAGTASGHRHSRVRSWYYRRSAGS